MELAPTPGAGFHVPNRNAEPVRSSVALMTR
jgi:hypothetical protein